MIYRNVLATAFIFYGRSPSNPIKRPFAVEVTRMKSPCIGVCRFDGRTGWCVACARTLAECREWKKAPRPRLLAINKMLPARLNKLTERGIRVVEEDV
jgi:predicted Fe-S protein YdhL (DUF1289 family)